MKKIFLIIIILIEVHAFSQSQSGSTEATIATDMPTIIPPSPTVASLMKFEEVPVNNYTGIPDVSVPLYSMETGSENVRLDISLKYHPLSINKDEFASYSGLGWNLLAGGSVSRTVRGFPDEIIIEGNANVNSQQGSNGKDKTRIGIYNNHLAEAFSNKYYQVMSLFGNIVTQSDKNIVGEYCWKAFEKGVFDSDHDLYQFNFMGKSGRFYIKKNIQTHSLEVVKLDNDNAIKIDLNYSFLNNKYQILGFTIYDDKGIKYVFEDVELTTEHSYTGSTSFKGDAPSLNVSEPLVYSSSFQLSRVYDTNNNLLITFSYSSVAETTERRTSMNNYIMPAQLETQVVGWLNSSTPPEINGLLPKQTITLKTTHIVSKKLSLINVHGRGIVSFVNESGRFDTNLNNTGVKLKNIIVKNVFKKTVKQIELNYDYTSIAPLNVNDELTRLILTEVKSKSNNNLDTESYKMFYKHDIVNGAQINMDSWGYTSNSNINKPMLSSFDAVGVLEKLSLPTGGCLQFDFGSNKYSYIGNQEITDFSKNPDNWIFTTQLKGPYSHSGYTSIEDISLGAPVSYVRYLKYQKEIIANNQEDFLVNLYKKSLGGTLTTAVRDGEYYVLEPHEEYIFRFSRFNVHNTGTLNLVLNYHRQSNTTLEQLNGGGIRINRIAYFDVDVDQDYYRNEAYYNSNSIIPSKEKLFDYNFFNTFKSSGSLVFPEPVFSYETSQPIQSPQLSINSMSYVTKTDYDNLQSARTHGSHIGYKNVTVKVKGDGEGKTEYIYTTPIDYPEDNYTASYPFIPSINRDYRRGQLVLESKYKKEGILYKLVSQDEYTYAIDSVMTVTGIRGNNVNKCPQAGKFNFYSEYIYCLNTPCSSVGSILHCDTNYFLNFMTVYDSFGWSKLMSKTTTDYFYDATTTNSLTKQETYTYNSVNKKIASKTQTNSMGDIVTTNYSYDLGGFISHNRISEIGMIETYRSSSLLSKNKIMYRNTFNGNTSYLPELIQSSKGDGVLENKLVYNLYDNDSNVLEVQQADGTKISYIWGYNNTLPVAKLENVSYSNIPTALITAIQSATYVAPLNEIEYNDVIYNESNVLSALNALRVDASLSGAQITTLTHTPLVGVTSITDPKGDVIRYYYDAFNRLKEVRDKDNNLLNEHEYHYRP